MKQQSSTQVKANSDIEAHNPFKDLVVAQAAVYSGMITHFGRGIAKKLVSKNAKLHVFASQLPVFGFPPQIDDLENNIGGTFHGLPLPTGFSPIHSLWSFILLTIQLRRLKVDVIHTRGSVMGIIGRIAAKLANVPIIIHHQDDLYSRDGELSQWKRQWVILIERTLAQLTDCSLFISNAVLQDALAVGFPPERCKVVGINFNEDFIQAMRDLPTNQEPARDYLRLIGVPDESKIVGCIGRFVYSKCLDLLLKAAEQLIPQFPDWVFVIKGDGPLLEAMKEEISKSGYSDRIYLFTDVLDISELVSFYRCIDIFALPTRREGYGLVFAEAMAMGIPTIGPRIAPVTEVIDETQDVGILVEPENVESLVTALKELMVDSNRCQDLGKRSRVYAINKWCNGISTDQVIDIYEKLLTQNSAH